MDFNFFKLADKKLTEWVDKNAEFIDIKKDTTFINESKEIKSLFVIISGQVEVNTSTQGSKNITLATLEDGAMIGEMSYLEKKNPVASVKSITDLKLIAIKFQIISDQIESNYELSKSFYKLISTKLCSQLLSQNKLIGYVHSNYDDSNEPLRKFISLFSSLDELDISWMSNIGKVISIDENNFLISQGEKLNYIYIVLSGRGDVFINENDKDIMVGISKRGELLGETSMLVSAQQNATASVRAKTQMDVLAISRNKLFSKIRDDSDFATRFYKGIAIMLSQRSRDQLNNIGLNYLSNNLNQIEGNNILNDELDFDLISSISKASSRFDRLCNQLYST